MSPSHVSGHQLHQAAQLLIRAAEQLSDSPATGGSGGNLGGQTSRQQQPQSSGTSGTGPSGRCAATSSIGPAVTVPFYQSYRSMPYPYRFPRCSSRRQVNRAHGGLPATAKSGSRRTWKHSFVCLAKVMQDMVPDSAERVQLLQAGLGERQLCLDIHW